MPSETPKKRGRPLGSKNRPKTSVPLPDTPPPGVRAGLPKEVYQGLIRYATFRRHVDNPRHSFPALFFQPSKMQKTALESKARTLFVGGANRTGKTLTQAVNVALMMNGVKGLQYKATDGTAFSRDCEPVHGWAVAKTYAQAREVVIKKLKWALGKTLARFDETRNIMYTWNGSTVTIKSEDSGFEVFQGADLDFVWKDEIGDPVIFGECKARLVDRDGVMLVSFTPTRGRDWSYSQYYRPWLEKSLGKPVEAEGVLFAHLGSMYDNPYLPRAAVLEMEKRCYSEEEKQIRMLGLYVDSAGLVFPNYSGSRHLVKPFEIPVHWPKFRGMDWGQRSPACCLWLAVDPDSGKHYVYREFYKKEQTIEQIAAAIKGMSGTERYALTVLDPSCWNREGHKDGLGNHYTKALIYQQHGIPVVKAMNDIQVGIDRVKGLLGRPDEEPMLYFFDGETPNLVREILDWPWTEVSHGVQITGGNLPDKPDKKHDDHALDSCRYACMATKFMVKMDTTGFDAGDGTGFEDEEQGVGVVRAVTEKVQVPGGFQYQTVRKRVVDDGFSEHGVDPSGGFDG